MSEDSVQIMSETEPNTRETANQHLTPTKPENSVPDGGGIHETPHKENQEITLKAGADDEPKLHTDTRPSSPGENLAQPQMKTEKNVETLSDEEQRSVMSGEYVDTEDQPNIIRSKVSREYDVNTYRQTYQPAQSKRSECCILI